MSETQYEGGYRGATRESYYRGKKLGTTLKADTATDTARAKRDAAIVKDMLAQEKEVKAAWTVWDKNQDLLKKEAVDIWNTLTKVPDKVLKVMEARKTIIQDKEYDYAIEAYENQTDIEREEARKYYEGLLTEDRKIGDQAESRAQDVENLGIKGDLPNFLRGKSRVFKNTMMVQIGREVLYSYPQISDAVWSSNEQIFTDTKGEKFSATEAEHDPDRKAIVWRHIRKKLLIGITAGGLDLKAANAVLGKEIDELILKDRGNRELQNTREVANDQLNQRESGLSFAIQTVGTETRDDGSTYISDPGGVLDQIKSYSILAPGLYKNKGVQQPGTEVKNTIDKAIALSLSQGMGTEELSYILQNARVQRPGSSKKGDLISLGELDSKLFNVDRYSKLLTAGGSVTAGGMTIQGYSEAGTAKDLVNASGFTNSKFHTEGAEVFDHTTVRKDLNDEEQEEFDKTPLGQLMLRAKTERISIEDLVKIASDPKNNYSRALKNSILRMDLDSLLDADTSLEIINANIEGNELILPEGVVLNQDVLGDFLQRNPDIKLAEGYTKTQVEARRTNYSNIEQLVAPNGITTPNQQIATEKLEAIQLEFESIIRREDRLDNGQIDLSREEVINQAFEKTKDYFATNPEFERDQDGGYPAIAAQTERWWSNKTEFKKAENELRARQLIKLNLDNNNPNTRVTETHKIPNIRNLLTKSRGNIIKHGVPKQELVDLARVLKVNVYDLMNDQALLYGLAGEGEVYQEVPITAQTFLGSVKQNEVNELVQKLIPLDKGEPTDHLSSFAIGANLPRTPKDLAQSLSAMRVVEGMLKKVQLKNGVTAIRPDETGLLEALSFTDGGDYKAVSPEGHLGRYRISPAIAKQVCGQLNIPYNQASFLSDSKIQDKVARVYLRSLIDSPNNKETTTINKIRWVLRAWTGTEQVPTVQLDERSNQETFIIHRYVDSRRGGP